MLACVTDSVIGTITSRCHFGPTIMPHSPFYRIYVNNNIANILERVKVLEPFTETKNAMEKLDVLFECKVVILKN